MSISGTATIDGTLNIILINGFSPSVGDSFEIMAFAALSGSFAATNGLNLGGGLFLDPNYANGGLTLVTESI